MSKNDSKPCYIENEWRAYLVGDIPEEERLEMEEHLLRCDHCLQVYLNLLEEQSTQEYGLRKDFTERVLSEIQSEKNPAVLTLSETIPAKREYVAQSSTQCIPVIRVSAETSRSCEQLTKLSTPTAKEKRVNRTNLLISYCAAASIVFFLWTGGYISGLSKTLNEGVLKGEAQISETGEKKLDLSVSLIQSGWTKKSIQEERPSLIPHFLEKKE